MTSKGKRNRIIHFCGIVIGIMMTSFLLISGLLPSGRAHAEDPEGLSLPEDNGENVSPSNPWQEDYKYTLEDQAIFINEYNGSDDSCEIVIPTVAVIGNNTYTTFIKPTTSLFPKDNVISFEVEEGVIIDSAAGMFDGCTKLERVDLSKATGGDNFNSTSRMFYDCSGLYSVDFGDFNLDTVTDMTDMFGNCTGLKELDLSGITFESLNQQGETETLELHMFDGCTSLKTLKLPTEFGDSVELCLPFKMYIKNDDGTIEEYEKVSKEQAGKTLVADLGKEKTSITAKNKTVTYDGREIDISDMFEIPETAGSVSYEVSLETASENTVTLSSPLFTVTKAGKYVVSVYTEETARFEAGSASANLTVRRAQGEGYVTCDDVTYGSKPSPRAQSSTNPGDPVFLYRLSSEGDNTYTVEVPTNPGKYMVKALFPDTDLYECSVISEFTIKEPENNNGGNANGENNGGGSSNKENNGGGSSNVENNGGGKAVDENKGRNNSKAETDIGYSGKGNNAEIAKNINGLAVGDDNCWHLYKNGKIQSDFNDLYCDEKLGWWKVKNGAVDFGYTGLYYSETYGWWLIGSGSVAFEYNDLWNDETLGWWKIKDGAVDFGYTGLYYSETYGWWLIGSGQVAFGFNDLWYDPVLGWWKVAGGKVDFDYTGLYYTETYGWWLIGAGQVAFSYNDLWNDPVLGWWKISGGTVDFGFTGLYYSETYGWWLIKAGSIAFDYYGLWEDPVYGGWIINGGTI